MRRHGANEKLLAIPGAFLVSESESQRPPVLGSWSVNPHPDDVWEAAMAALEAGLDVCADPVAGRLIYLEGPIGLGCEALARV